MPQVQTIRDQLAREWGEAVGDTDIQNLLEEWIQEVFDTIVASSDYLWWNRFEQDINTVASTADYTLDTGHRQATIIRFKDETFGPLEYKAVEELIEAGFDLEEEEAPRFWWDSGYDATNDVTQISLWPTPDAVYNLEAIIQGSPTSLSDTTIIPLPREWLPVLKDGVRRIFREFDGDYEGAERAERRFLAMMRGLERRFKKKPGARHKLEATDVSRGFNFEFIRFPPDKFSNF